MLPIEREESLVCIFGYRFRSLCHNARNSDSVQRVICRTLATFGTIQDDLRVQQILKANNNSAPRAANIVFSPCLNWIFCQFTACCFSVAWHLVRNHQPLFTPTPCETCLWCIRALTRGSGRLKFVQLDPLGQFLDSSVYFGAARQVVSRPRAMVHALICT